MNQYVATFHTHVAALMTSRSMMKEGISCRMAPVPRKLSSSCGTCVFYDAETPKTEIMDTDVENIYRIVDENSYQTISKNQ